MKKIKLLALVAGALMVGNVAGAQKIAAIDAQAVLYAMPEMQDVQKKMEEYSNDTLGAEFNRLSAEYKIKDSTYNDAKTNASVKKSIENDLLQLRSTLANWQQVAAPYYQNKQGALMAPLSEKLQRTITTYAKEKGYTHVLARDAVYVLPDADDITLAVATRLGIKPGAQQGAPAPKPGTTPRR